MEEQLLKDFLETAKQNNYNWDVIMPKFPELAGVDLQLLKDYAETAKQNNYDYSVVNPKFPELFGDKGTQSSNAPVKKKDSTDSSSEDGSLDSQDSPSSLYDEWEQRYNISQAGVSPIPSLDELQVDDDMRGVQEFEEPILETEEVIQQPADVDRSERIVLPTEAEQSTTSEFTGIPEEVASQDTRSLQDKITSEQRDATASSELIDKPSWSKYSTKEKEAELSVKSKELFDSELQNITKKLIDREEEFVVPQMNNAFGDYGFSFEEASALGDKMVVRAKNGESIRIDLDPLLESTEEAEAEKLIKFLSDNRVDSQFLAQKEGVYVSDEKRITSRRELNTKFESLNQDTRSFEDDVNLYLEKSRDAKRMGEVLSSLSEEEMKTPEFAAKRQEYMYMVGNLERSRVSLVEREESIRGEGKKIDRLAGEYFEMAEEQGTYGGAIWNSIVGEGVGRFVGAFTSHGIDVSTYLKGAESYLGTQGYQDSYEKRAFDILGESKPEGMSFVDWKNGLPEKYNAYKIKEVESAVLDDARKTEKFGEISRSRNPFSQAAAMAFDASEGEVDRARSLAKGLIGSDETTKEYVDNIKENSFFGGSVLGVMESLPAMLVPGAARAIAFGAQYEDALNQEMEANPEFDNISETEKLKLTIPLALTAGVLEEFGFRNLMSQKGFLSDVMMSAISKTGKKVTARTFKEFVEKDVNNRLSKGLLTMTASGLAEFETGALQQVAEFGAKDIYNAVKGKEMFDTPDSRAEWLSEVLYSGAQEMVGGMVMGSIPATVTAFSSGKAKKLDNETFTLFNEIRKDPNYRKFYDAELKRKVALQEITAEERVEKLGLYDTVSAIAHNVPANLTTSKKKAAVELLMKKAELEREVEGKDRALVKKKIEEIKSIDEKLESLSEVVKPSKEDTDAFNALPKSTQKTFLGITNGDRNSAIEMFKEEQAKLKEVFGEQPVEDKAPIGMKALKAMVEPAMKAMSQVSKGTKIVIHKTNEEYVAAGGANFEGGQYVPTDNTIHINASAATATTIPHEVFHAVFISKVKTEPKAAAAAKTMLKAVRRAIPKNSELAKKIDAHMSLYDEHINEEGLAELTGILSSMKDGYGKLDTTAKNAVADFFKKIAKALGISDLLGENFGKTDESVIDLINTLAKKTATGEVITAQDVEILDNGTNPIGKPTEIRIPKKKKRQQKLSFKDSYENSLITPDKSVDINGLIEEIVGKNQKVWFWVADQLGVNETIDGGPSFAYKTPGDIWASSMPTKGILNNMADSEYLFIISGSPQRSKMFNKSVYDVMVDRLGEYGTFKKEVLGMGAVKDIREALDKYNSWEEMRESSDRKPFLVALDKSKNTPNAAVSKYIQSIDGYTDVDALRDGFYRDNDFKQNDIMLVLKPTGAREGANHSTYTNTVEGEVIGVPNEKVNALEVMPQEMSDKYEGRRSQAAQAIAPYGSGRKKIKPRQQKLASATTNGETITTDTEHTLFKGMLSKMKNGKPYSVHKIKEGTFAALDKKLANDYKGDKPLKQFTMPAGTTVQVVKLDTKEGADAFRRKEEQAIDASDAQVVKLITLDARGKSEQYIIKDRDIVRSAKDVVETKRPISKEDAIASQPMSKRRRAIIERAKAKEAAQTPSVRRQKLAPENSSNYANLTEDGEGNFVFYHVGKKGYKQVRPSTGNRYTSRPEATALSKVGGLGMYYTNKNDGESMVTGEAKYEVKVPMDKVYDFNSDPLNLIEEAREMHKKRYPGKSFGKNEQLAFVTKVAEKKGYDMVVSEWKDGTRAQTTKSLKPTDVSIRKGDTVTQDFKKSYDSNKDKGFKSVIPKTKSEKLVEIYNKMSDVKNKEGKYDALYHLRTEYRNKTQEEISKLINESDISQELKDEYNDILKSKDETRKSVKDAKAGQRLFNNPNPETSKIAEKYKQENGIETEAGKPIKKLDKQKAKKIADEYDKLEHAPNDPQVIAAYNALAEETVSQYDAIIDAGYEVEVSEAEGEPYNNSEEMIKDTVDNKHLFVLATDAAFGDGESVDSPLLKDSGRKDVNGRPLLVNDLFRAVHDFFGHTERGNGFGALGEENAWDVHARMFSPLARRAMTTETKGQNSWINFSGANDAATAKILEARKLDNQGKTEEASAVREKGLSEFKFAEQKTGLMPEWVSDMAPRKQKSVASKPVKVNEDGNHLNIGMKVGQTNEDISADEIKGAIPNDVKVLNEEVIEEGSSEQTLALEISRALDNTEMGDLMVETQQEAIPQVSNNEGVLHAQTQEALDDWGGAFNPEYFTFSTRKQKTISKEEAIAKQPMSKRRRAIIERAKAKEAAQTPSARRQIIGESAELSQNVRDNLSVARQMEGAKESIKDIRLATGWERGVDGKWRYEIEDLSDAQLSKIEKWLSDNLIGHNKKSFFESLEEIKGDESQKGLYRGTLKRKFFPTSFEWLVGNYIYHKLKPTLQETSKTVTLGDLSIAFPNILNKYPFLNDVTIISEEGKRGATLAEDRQTITMGVDAQAMFETATHLTHEVQHIIQEEEGFASGGNPKNRTPAARRVFNEIRGIAKKEGMTISEMHRQADGESILNISPEMGVSEKYKNLKGNKKIVTYLEDSRYKGDFKNPREVAKAIRLFKQSEVFLGLEGYNKLAGEAEARNAQKRMAMTPEQRRKTTLQETEDVAREDQILFLPSADNAKGAMEVIAKGRQQKDMVGTIAKAREEGISDAAIKDYLTRVLKYPAKEVKSAMTIQVDLLTELPESFKNIDGGAEAGIKLFNRVKAYEQKLVAANKRRAKNKMSKQDIADKVIEYLEEQPEYKAEAETYTVGSKKKGTQKTKQRKHFSAQQAAMIVEFQKEVGTRPSKGLSKKLKELRDSITNRKRGARSLQEAKSKVKMLLRKGLPTSLYTKSEVIDIIRKIDAATEANTKDLDGEIGSSIENILTEVSQLIVSKNISILDKKIGNILTGKFTKRELGRLKGKKISIKAKERIDKIKAEMLGPKATAEEINAANAKLIARFNAIAAKENMTETDAQEMSDIKTMINLNSLALMEDTNAFKIATLDSILSDLNSIVDEGRTEFQEEIAAAKKKYDDNASIAYEEITGEKVDFSDPEAKPTLDAKNFERNNDAQRKKMQGNIKKFFAAAAEKVKMIFVSHEALDGLMDLVSKMPGELFGGRLQEIVTARFDESTRKYKKRIMEQEAAVKGKLRDLYGRKWAKVVRKHNSPEATGIIVNGKELILSQNQMYYLYNQYKDPANHKAFESMGMYGVESIKKTDSKEEIEAKNAKNKANAERVMGEMEAKLKPEVKAFADWQVDEYLPSLYEHYNEVYKRIYRTNLPWNEFYAGRIYREGIEMETLDLLADNTVHNTMAGAASTKARVNSSAAIKSMNGTDVLSSYIKDMEHFAAYAESVRDIDRMFSNKYVQNAISNIYGKDVYGLIKDKIKTISNRGGVATKGDKIVDAMNTAFVVSRIALSPVIMVKQLISFATYANDIGPINWVKYAAKNMAELRGVLKEVKENSVYMQDRKRESMFRVIESYSNDSMTSFIPNPTKEFYTNFMMWFVKQGDAGAIYMGGLPNYSYYKAEAIKAGKTEQQAIDIAIRKFERDTKRTQQSQDLQDKDVFQTGDALKRAMNMFLTTPRQYMRKEIQAVRNLYRKIAAWDKTAGKGTRGENIRTFVMYHVINPMLFQYISMGLPGLLRPMRDDDDEDLMRAAILGNLNGLFILGELFSGVGDLVTKKPYAMSDTRSVGILQISFRIGQLYKRWDKTKDPVKKEAALNKLVLESLTLTSAPAPTVDRMYKNYSKVAEGDGDVGENILRLLNYSEYQIMGGSSKKTKKTKTKKTKTKKTKTKKTR